MDELLIFFTVGSHRKLSLISSLFVGLRYAPASSKTRNEERKQVTEGLIAHTEGLIAPRQQNQRSLYYGVFGSSRSDEGSLYSDSP